LNLFDAIGLKGDPFSTSPNVDLFYPAVEHRQCLEGLELALRMRRGLSVVKGGIGVGKTTISRKLIQNFKDDSDDFAFHLILDPKFESEIILLKHIIELFGINESAESVQDCRNIIENYLLRVGVDQDKTLVLIVDEGQNLPGKMLDVFRTLLNFETDEYKLLQLIIFGQPEMSKIIKEYPNFEDRISFNFELGPISLEDTKGMIEHRIQVTGGKSQHWFKNEAIIKIHKNTQGYPRKITQLCHQALLGMISEEKEEITEDIIQRVISGKIDTGGLLKQKKKRYNEIAVNKLLDVLQKDEPTIEKKSIISNKAIYEEEEEEEDWIGKGDDISTILEDEEKNSKYTAENQIENTENHKSKTNSESIIQKETVLNTQINVEPPSESQNSDIEDQFLPSQGKYNKNIKASILNKLPFDKVFIGLHIDSYRFITVVIEERNGIKTLLSHNIFLFEKDDFTYINDFEEIMNHFPHIQDDLIDQLSDFGTLYNSAIQTIKQRSAVALTIDDDHISSHIIKVPHQSEKEKNQIIQFSINKNISYPVEDAIITHRKGKKEIYYASVGTKIDLERFGNYFHHNQWNIRKWYPLAQAIYNAFLWNYPDRKNATTLIIHIGENNGSILCCEKTELKAIRPLYIGLLSLIDALKDNGMYKTKKDEEHRKLFSVPETLLSIADQKLNKGEYDGIFRSVFENWKQEIDRIVNDIRNEVKISDDSEILLSGSAGDITHLDKFIQLATGIKTRFMNPIRNLAVTTNFNSNSLEYNPALLTGSIGAGINILGNSSILPKNLKQYEMLRWINRGGILTAAATIAFCAILSFHKKINVNELRTLLNPMQVQNNSLKHIETKHKQLTKNTANVENQLDKLSDDTQYFDRILVVNRILSYYTPKEIRISEANFQKGWDKEGYKKVGRELVKIVHKEDEDLRILKLVGQVESNSALLETHFNNFLAMLEETNAFQEIEVKSESIKRGGKNSEQNLSFQLKCVL